MSMQIEFTASEAVRQGLAGLARTEDVKFSPDNRRLAIAGYARSRLVVIDVDIAADSSGTRVTLSNFLEITSSSLNEPHGLFFIDDQTLIVANRRGKAPILKLPARGTGDVTVALSALRTLRGNLWNRVKSPGSVSVLRTDRDRYEVLLCNNYAHYVTRHILDGSANFRVKSNTILLRKGLDIPDGVAFNSDGSWIAISNHSNHNVLLFRNTPGLNRRSEPDGILRMVSFPHGVRFTPDDRFVLVADAGAPYVHVYTRGTESWQGMHDPLRSLRVMDDATFLRGRYNPQEGGPKGIDIDSRMNVLVATCEHQVLAFFDLPAMLNRGKPKRA